MAARKSQTQTPQTPDMAAMIAEAVAAALATQTPDTDATDEKPTAKKAQTAAQKKRAATAAKLGNIDPVIVTDPDLGTRFRFEREPNYARYMKVTELAKDGTDRRHKRVPVAALRVAMEQEGFAELLTA